MQENVSDKRYKLRAADGTTYLSATPGELGGYKPKRIYGRLDCSSANRHLKIGGYADHRVFFADESVAIAAGFRPCGKCLKQRYATWNAGGEIGTANYPWLLLPKASEHREE